MANLRKLGSFFAEFYGNHPGKTGGEHEKVPDARGQDLDEQNEGISEYFPGEN